MITTRADAKARGLTRYFTGVPCSRGHVAERLVSTFTCVECARLATAAFHEAHPEVVLRKSANWRKRHPLKEKKKLRRWAVENPELKRANRHRYRAKKRSADGAHTAADARDLRQKQNGRCAYCRKNLGRKGQLDHIVALSLGGSNRPSNLQWLCEDCNKSKGARDAADYARERGLLL